MTDPEGDMDEAEDPVDDLARHFKALAHEKRIRVLRFLVEPHHLEEIASHLGVARQSAQEHVQQLLELGLLRAVRGRGAHGAAVTAYIVIPQRLFAVQEMFSRLGDLESDAGDDLEMRMRTMTEPGVPVRTEDDALPRLVVVHGMRLGRTLVLRGDGPWLLGRAQDADLSLDYDPFASSRHAEVRRAPQGFALADLHSSNGTYHDWQRLPRGASEPLTSGSIIRVGKSLMVFRKP